MITLVYPYFNNGQMLDRQLEEWARYENKDQWKAIIVDDGSQRDPALSHMIDVGFEIELYRITDDIAWNQDGARNLAMKHASGFCLLADMDHLLTADQASKLAALEFDKAKSYRFNRQLLNRKEINVAPNIWLMHADLFWQCGGYDERYAGYYGSDRFFCISVKEKAGAPRVLDICMTVYLGADLPDANTTDYGRTKSKHDLDQVGVTFKPVPQINFNWERLI